ncbi:MAG: HD domain-containing protein [Candidatus Methanomethylophilaceae archaeon]|jgi:putative hydrolase of HD superfamily|nr:HD domain-containing protein [Candidatus Methanomethylophilaceae archaeon]NCA73356.1 HD domain-containing protein [Gammaproteobacteria bacterium]
MTGTERMSKALNAEMLYFMFESANMHRWNDHLRPLDLTEQDKQSHKAAIAWVIAKFEEDEGRDIDWRALIEHNLFELISRLVLTDLKPQFYHRIVDEKFDQVNEYVIKEFDRNVPDTDPEFRKRLSYYLKSKRDSPEDRIIDAAHYLATKWEFDLIYEMNKGMFDADNTKKAIDGQIARHENLAGVRMIMAGGGIKGFVDLIGQLRFQQRWARTPRIPKTTVLGHSLMVANSIFLHDLDAGAADKQIYNDYYAGLFHDLPEVLTKDVISPVKNNVSGLAQMLEGYEREQIESKLMPLIPESWRGEMEFLTYEPFSDSDDTGYGMRAGRDIKSCDLLAAYIEAHVSASYGISSQSLTEGKEELLTRLVNTGDGIGARELVVRLGRIKI